VVGDAGLLFPRDDVISLAAALARLLDDPAERVALGKRARGRAEGLSWVRTWTALLAAAEPNDVVGGDSVASTATVVPTP
jgi:glycosyltransferase involved in cell wall biosynthesis